MKKMFTMMVACAALTGCTHAMVTPVVTQVHVMQDAAGHPILHVFSCTPEYNVLEGFQSGPCSATDEPMPYGQ